MVEQIRSYFAEVSIAVELLMDSVGSKNKSAPVRGTQAGSVPASRRLNIGFLQGCVFETVWIQRKQCSNNEGREQPEPIFIDVYQKGDFKHQNETSEL